MKKLILFIVSLILISVFFSGCCQCWFWPGPVVVAQPAPAPVIIRPGVPLH